MESSDTHGEVFLDARGHGRALRLTWHHEADLVVLSLWREDVCAGTFRLSTADVNAFIDALVDGVRDAPGVHLPDPSDADAAPPAQRVGTPSAAASAADTGDVDPELTRQINAAPAAEPAFADWAFGSEPKATAS